MRIDVFRFDGYEDVFIEDDHYLYACAEVFGWPHLVAVREYSKKDLTRSDCAGADVEYLQGLEHAPADIARTIILIETKEYLSHVEDMSEDEKESYIEEKMAEYRNM